MLLICNAKFDVFTAVKFQVEIFWVVTSPWRWRHYDPPKRWYPTITLNGVTTQKTSTRTCLISVLIYEDYIGPILIETELDQYW